MRPKRARGAGPRDAGTNHQAARADDPAGIWENSELRISMGIFDEFMNLFGKKKHLSGRDA